MTVESNVCIAALCPATILACLAYRWRVRRICGRLKTDFEQRLIESTQTTQERCEILLTAIDASRTVAERALSASPTLPALRAALDGIFLLLSEGLGNSSRTGS